MVKKEENKIENIKLLENILSNNDAKKALKELSDAKAVLDGFLAKIKEKINEQRALEAKQKAEKLAAESKAENVADKPVKTVREDKPRTFNNTNYNNNFNRNNNYNPSSNSFGGNNYNRGNNFSQNNAQNGFKRPFNNGNRPNNFNNSAEGFKKPAFNNGNKPFNNNKPSLRPIEAPIIIKEKERILNKNKKKTHETPQENKPLNKKAKFIMNLVNDDMEERVIYRRVKTKKETKQPVQQHIAVLDHAVITTENISVKDLSEKIGKPVTEIIKKLFILGIMSTINSTINFETAELVSNELGVTLEYKPVETFEEKLSKEMASVDLEENLVKRAPVVTVMGHVDHGKTSLLDAIRKTNVISGEAGGITQHIGAYTVKYNGELIAFIDTPGHAAFTAMRERGAKVTDVAILVVAADDGIKPQTIEAINIIKNSNVPMIVAINKIDKQEANVDRVKQQLADYGVLSDEWGGDTIMVPISAKHNQNIDKLLEMVLLQSEVLELKVNPNKKATGSVIEARLDKGMGPVATILVQSGTLKVGDTVVAGVCVGRIRAMLDEKGKNIKEAGPSIPVSVLGLDDVPNSGDQVYAVDEKMSKQIIEERKDRIKNARNSQTNSASVEDLFSKAEDNMKKQLNVIVKADVQGSAEALKQSILEITSEEVKVNVISCGVGIVNETDTQLAITTNATIICFNNKADSKSKTLIERNKVDIYYSRVIYDVVDFLTDKMKSMFTPKIKDVYAGKVEVRVIYKISNVGTIAGSYVLDGKVVRNAKANVVRNDEIIGTYTVESVKIKKDDVKEANYGYECGVKLAGFTDFKEGDILEIYTSERIYE